MDDVGDLGGKSSVLAVVLRATLSASDGLWAMTSDLVISCHSGSSTCSPPTLRVTKPSSSYCAQFLAKKALDRTTTPNALWATP